eukprot:CAMPEP_0113441706 /NCGR_PEP_ID=MMETSP0014_2-20120614/1222_1 /TAXON_ID=2857 /ORGANISM="Nitzschia sp." /LENGTH=694 /DNA_ID=CAMNT_0000332561 /DNA_START=23 /DNA_END=2107 /DNA_ORIENTATION=- /assembly_acc=CAM_ASM_000159
MSSSTGTGTAANKVTHVTESIADRKAARELAEARQSGAVEPAVDVSTGKIINPHNPEFITKKPWYLGADGGDAGPSLDHQANIASTDSMTLSMAAADALVQESRLKEKQKRQKGLFEVGMWVEAMRNGKGPYKICQIMKLAKKGTVFDLKYEDGSIEKKVKFKSKKTGSGSMFKPRIKMTKSGTRSLDIDSSKYGKESWSSKRDQYHGYDADSHTKKVERIFQEREDLRRKIREEERKKEEEEQRKEKQEDEGAGEAAEGGTASQKKREKASMSDSDADSDVEDDDDNDSDDEFVQKDEKLFTSRLARQGGVGGAQMKVTARNLRIREDTAKYLRNLDANSAYYDPKSRSMRDNPHPEMAPEEVQFAGDNFARISGDAVKLAETQLFAWDASDKGVSELHPQANPSQAELLKKKFQSKSSELARQKKKKVLDKYGGGEYLDGSGGLADALDADATAGNGNMDYSKGSKAVQERKIRFGVSTVAEEYTQDGRRVKGQSTVKRVPQKSKYEEDVLVNGHTSVWGSYFHIGAFTWGYADDHSLMKSSYCTGAAGRVANDEANEMRYGTGVAGSAALAQARGMLKALPSGGNSSSTNSKIDPHLTRSRLYGEADQKVEVDQKDLKAALEKYDQGDGNNKRSTSSSGNTDNDDRKRKYNSMAAEVDVTDAEMEAYRLRKERSSDPMNKIGSDEILDYRK